MKSLALAEKGVMFGGGYEGTFPNGFSLDASAYPLPRPSPHPNIPRPQRVGRLAPSPTGALHLGNVRTFMAAWLQMRAVGGTVRLRIEDLDHPKHKPGAAAALMEDLRWLGFDWDGPVVWQSQRTEAYAAALCRLAPDLYPCHCTRADILGAQSAPHPGDVLRYNGHCRNRGRADGWKIGGAEAWGGIAHGEAGTQGALPPVGMRDLRSTLPSPLPPPTSRCQAECSPAWRLALGVTDDGRFTDAFAGPQTRTAAELTGDFVVARGTEAAYALAVVVDDAAMGVTDVVRGDDILPATPAQIVLYRRLGWEAPTFWHLPLVVGADGHRLAKRHGDTRIAAYRAAGVSPGRILSALARSCGWLGPGEAVAAPAELLPRFSFDAIPHEPFVWKEELL